MDSKQLILHHFTKIYNKTEDEIKELIFDGDELKENANQILLDADADRVAKLKEVSNDERGLIMTDAHNKAKGEILGKFEKNFKEQTGFESDKQGLDLVLEWGKTQGGGNLTEDEIKKTPAYIARELELKENYDAELNAANKALEDYKSEIARSQSFSAQATQTERFFLDLNPVLSADKAKAKRQTELFINDIMSHNHTTVDGILIDKDGKRVEDKHGNPVTFEAFVKLEAQKVYDFQTQSPRKNTGNNNNGNVSFTVPTNAREYSIALANAKSPEERIKVGDAYDEYRKK